MLEYVCTFYKFHERMTKMKRFLCLIIALLMVLPSTAAMAAKQFIDVEADNSYSTAIYTLADFGIIKGDAGADTFRPKDGISREEFSVIMVRCLGLGDLQVDITEYPFTDVTPETVDDWSINATKIAYDQGIIKGMGDGTFAPKADVTYEQAVKMIVCALGYENHAINQGGWPNGYISIARELGITKRAESPQEQAAPRGVIAQLIYNSLDVDLMIPYMDSNGVQRYSSTPGQNLLNQKLKLTKATGVVTAVKNSALGEDAIGVEADEVKIDFFTKFKIGETGADKYFSQRVTYYYKTDNDTKTLVSVIPTTDNKTIELSSENIKTIDNTKIEYYKDADDTSVFETLNLNTPVYLIFNGAHATLNGPLTIETGSAKLIDNDSDGSINVIIVDASVTILVDAVDTTNYIVYDTYDQANKLELNPDSSDIINITKNGSKVEFTSIQKGDVLLVSQSTNATGSITKNIKIVTNTVSGTISQLGSDYEEVVISGKTYELSKKFINYIKKTPSFKFAIDNKVTCYLDDSNKIVAAKVTSVAATSTFKYGYLIAAGVSSRDDVVEFRIHTQDSKTVTYTGAEKIRVNNGSTSGSYPYTDVIDAIQNTNSINYTNKDAGYTAPAELNGVVYIPQLIKFSVNSSGKVDNIITITTSGDIANDLVISKQYSADVKYNSSSSMLGSNVLLNANTKVFFVPSDRSKTEEYSVKNKSALKNNKPYEFESYNASSTNTAEVIVVYGNSGTITVDDYEAPLVIVDSITQTTNSEGDAVNKLECYQNGNVTTYLTESMSVLAGIKTGDIIRLQFNSSSELSKVKVMYAANTTPEFSNRLVLEDGNTSSPTISNADYMTVFGTVYSREENVMTVSLYDIDAQGELNGTDTKLITCDTNTKYYNYDGTKDKPITVSTINSIVGYTSAKTGASQIFAYVSNGKAKFVVTIKK